MLLVRYFVGTTSAKALVSPFLTYFLVTGNLIGPQTFRASQAPSYTGGFVAMLICYCVCIGLMAGYWLLAAVLNHRRQTLSSSSRIMEIATAAGGGNNDGSEIDGLANSVFADLTDFQQKEFRYTT